MSSDSQNQATSMRPISEHAPHKAAYFYQNDQLTTELSGSDSRHIFWAIGKALAQVEQPRNIRIFKVDDANSVIGTLTGEKQGLLAYSPYGYLTPAKRVALIGFNGQWQDPVSLAYLLGNGHRQLHTHIGRFGIADTLSPFGKGEVNAYAYCAGDPINREDSSGRWFGRIRKIFNKPPKYNTIGKLLNQGESLPNLATGISEKFDTSLPSHRQALAAGGWPGTPPPAYTDIPTPGQTTININLGVELTPIDGTSGRTELNQLRSRIDNFTTLTPLVENPESRRMQDTQQLTRDALILMHRLVSDTRRNTAR